MSIPADEIAAFFDAHHDSMREEWNRCVGQGSMSDWNRQRNEVMMDQIAMLLRVLSEGHARLTYVLHNE